MNPYTSNASTQRHIGASLCALALALLCSVLGAGEAKKPAAQTEAAGTGGPSAHNPCFDQAGLWPADVKKAGYSQQKWAPARVLVWAKRDKFQGDWAAAANWLEDGKPATKDADDSCDVEFPDGTYTVVGGVESEGWGGWGHIIVRHLTIGNGVEVKFTAWTVSGNLWIKAGARYSIIEGHWTGKGDAFARNDMGHWPELKIPTVDKLDNGSVETIGLWGNSDGLYVNTGKLIVGPDSIWCGGDRHQNTIGLKGSLILMSGATFQVYVNKHYAYDLDHYGELLAGTKERPLTKDCFFRLSEKSRRPGNFYQETPDDVGLMLRPQAHLVVTSADPAKARLVFDRWKSWRNDPKHSEPTGLVHLALLGKCDLNGVVFNHIALGGIGLADAALAKPWKNVSYGADNAGKPEQLIGTYTGKVRAEQPFFK